VTVIAQISDLHVGGARHEPALLDQVLVEIAELAPDLVVVCGDLTDEGYPDQYEVVKAALARLDGLEVVAVPGNHDAKHVGYLHWEAMLGERETRRRLTIDGEAVTIVGVDSSKPDIDEGEVGREHYKLIQEALATPADLRVFVCHHHLLPIPGTGRERNQVADAGDVLALLGANGVDLVLGGHRHVPFAWRIGGLVVAHSGTAASLRTRAFPHPAYNVITVGPESIAVELRIPGGERQALATFPRQRPTQANGCVTPGLPRQGFEWLVDPVRASGRALRSS